MKFSLDFSGLTEQLKALEEVASEKEMKAANKRVVERSTPIVKKPKKNREENHMTMEERMAQVEAQAAAKAAGAAQADTDLITGHLDVEQLKGMKMADLKALANDLGLKYPLITTRLIRKWVQEKI